MAIDKNQLSLKITDKPHFDYKSAIREITLTANYPGHGQIASLSAWLILRHTGSPEQDPFQVMLDLDHDELCDLSTTLFDRNGHILPHLIQPGYRSGSGVWDEALNRGTLVYVLDMTVKEQFRGQGIGSWVLNKFLQSDKVRKDDTAMCLPSPLNTSELSEDSRAAARARQIAFFRKNGFRRVGRTPFFGYSPDEKHRSRDLPIEQDVAAFDDDLSLPDPEAEYPLHGAIETQHDAGAIQASYDLDPQSIHARNANGFTPIHIAARFQNLHALRKLLEWDVDADLHNLSNIHGTTPLELLHMQMRLDRECVGSPSLQLSAEWLDWRGYSAEELETEYLLKQRLGLPVADTLQNHLVERKYGCSCGSCLGGWFSPRMRHQLSCQAAYASDGMPEMYEFFEGGRARSIADLPSSYLPQQTFTLKFYKAYRDIFNAIYQLLENTNELPSEAALQPFLSRTSSFYLNHGGRIAFAFDAITGCALDHSTIRGGDHEEIFGNEEDYTSLPRCANDLEFQLVRVMLGLNPRQRWGPYWQ
uniref:N-acetyltransferase domain-containing protein n=1 Tax=Mycena chlorophos TaxID=658473 RepID=A0ABQ0LGU9_MYCCL|nr:predicted protein [Mycena chlorophos]